MAISRPFTIQITPYNAASSSSPTLAKQGEPNSNLDPENIQQIEGLLLPVVQNCFDRDPDVAPRAVTEHFGPTLEREGKYARRVVYAVSRMFGIDFAPEVVRADGNVRNLSWRICNAKKVLAPYSMSSREPTTPTT